MSADEDEIVHHASPHASPHAKLGAVGFSRGYSDAGLYTSTEEDEKKIDPFEYVSELEEIVHHGVVFRKTGYQEVIAGRAGGSGVMENGETITWVPRKMWVTDTGGLFYYSHRHKKPLGGAIVGLKVSIAGLEPVVPGYWEFSVTSVEEGVIGAKPTVFATRTERERELWVQHLKEIHDEEEKEGGHMLDPLEGFTRCTSTDHRMRLHTLSSEATASAAAAAMLAVGDSSGDGAPYRRRRSKRLTTTVDKGGFDRLTTYGIEEFTTEDDQSPTDRRAPRIATNTFGDDVRASLTHSALAKTSSLAAFAPHGGKGGATGISDAGHGLSECSDESSAHISSPKVESLRSPRYNLPDIRRDSRTLFSKKDHTVLVLDWDDTIFPTTFVRKDCGLDWRRSIAEQVLPGPGRTELEALFVRLTACMESFITAACSTASVCIVTLAKHPWVLTSCDNFLPAFRPLMEKFNIKIIYARDCMTDDMRREYGANTFKTSDQEADFWMRAKQTAMTREIGEIHASRGSSWKNIISIGDSDFERVALLATAESHVRAASSTGQVAQSGLTSEFVTKDGHVQRLRAKTVKMLEDPSLEELIAQQTLLTSWLPFLINRDTGLDITFHNSEDDNQLNDLNRFVTGEDADLSWLTLAGVDPEKSDLDQE